jgi:hypothetical protein
LHAQYQLEEVRNAKTLAPSIRRQTERGLRRRGGAASQSFRCVEGALNTIASYEAMNIIRKGQIRSLPKTDSVGQIRLIERTLGIAP